MLTREQILAMKPGPQLDALIHEMIFGYKYLAHVTPEYSTDISAAWEVANKFDFFYLFRNPHIFNGEWECKLVAEDSSRKYYALGKTAPEAICKAALLAIGKDEKE